MPVKAFADLKTLKLKLRRDGGVQFTKAGTHWKARFQGHAAFVFGATKQEARQRLLSTPSSTYKNTVFNSWVRAKQKNMKRRGAA